MRLITSLKPLFLALVLLTGLGACDSPEEKAEEYFQNGLALMGEGDFDRAIVEFRNAFEFNSAHQEARRSLAEIYLLHKDNPRAAYRQYLLLAEQHPDDSDARINLGELAFETGNWEEFERHGTKARELVPDDTRVKAIAVALNYRQAVLDEDDSTARAAAENAKAMLSELPDSMILRGIVLDTQMRNNETFDALESLNWFIENDPDEIQHWRQRLMLLAQTEDMDAVEAQLKEMIARFPDNVENKQMLLRFYMSREQIDEAETFLRELAANDSNPNARADLVAFLLQVRGADAARAELEAAIAEEDNPAMFRVLRARLDFATGDRDGAIEELESVLEIAEINLETKQAAQIELAKFMITMGNDVGAQKHVKELLAEDDTNPEGLKMQAAWQIENDEPESAIAGLRAALDRAPEDAQAMTLMAQAYARTGRTELVKEFLALAVEASGNAPQETLRYVNVLISEESYLPAEDLLKDALRLAPQNVELLTAIGQLYLLMDDAARAEQVVRTLERLDTPQTRGLAQQLEAERLNMQDGTEQALSYLEQLAQSEGSGNGAKLNLIRAQLSTGDIEAALAGAQSLLTENPDNLNIRGLVAFILQNKGDLEEAEAIYREVLAENAALPVVWSQLAQLTRITSGLDAAQAVIDEGLGVVPGAPNLLLQSASLKEIKGDIDGAIEIYEGLYEIDSNSVLVANNLASLIATYRGDDADSVERAWTVARRLRDIKVPALQDTYGWILHLRGESADALTYLEAAAEGLPNDPIVQFHLAQIYNALDRPEQALAQYRKAVAVAGPADQREQIVLARTRVAELQQAGPDTDEDPAEQN